MNINMFSPPIQKALSLNPPSLNEHKSSEFKI